MCKSSLFSNYLFYMIFFLLRRTGGGWIIIYSFRNVFSTATDGGGSSQKHVLLFAKRAIKPVQGRTGLILPLFPLVSSCLFCLLPAMLLLSSKTASALYRPRMDVVLCSNEFDILSNSLSSVVQGRTTLDRGYRFYRCPRKLLYIHYESPHTAGTGYGERLFFFNNKSHNCLQAFIFYLKIFITLPLPIIFPSLIFFQIIFPIIRIQILYFTTYIIRYRCSPIINSLSFKFFYNVHLFFVFR